jgi:hypothetical protein
MALSGMLAANQLRTITGTTRLVRFDLLAQTDALRTAFLAHFGKSLVVTDGYRSYQSQVDVFTARYTKTYLAGRPYKVWNGERWYQRPGTAVAATPGTSNHGWAQAIDFGSGVNTSLTSPEFKWMAANAPRFGWTHPAWAKQAGTLEPWHWEATYVPPSSYAPVGPTPPTPIPPINPIPPTPEVPDMDDNDRRIAQETLDNAKAANQNSGWANTNADAARTAAQAGLSISQQLLNLLRSVAGTDQMILAQCNDLEVQIANMQSALSEQVKDVRQRAALATRKQYSGLAAEKTSYTDLEAQYGSYEDMAGVRDPLKASVTVDATIPPGQIEEEVKDALVAAAPALVDAINDDVAKRMKE